ncbi:MAG: hypothetical protein ACTHK0_13495 [Ginsengibacter sp.]
MERIGIYFEKDAIIQSLIQRHVPCRWSKTQRCWHMSLSKNDFEKLSLALKEHASLCTDELRKYLRKKEHHP